MNQPMAFSKSRKGDSEESKSLRKMSSEEAASLGGIVEPSLSDKGKNQIIDQSHEFACVAHCHAGDIAAIM